MHIKVTATRVVRSIVIGPKLGAVRFKKILWDNKLITDETNDVDVRSMLGLIRRPGVVSILPRTPRHRCTVSDR